MYKVYDPDGKPLIFDSLRKLREFFELSEEDSYKIFVSKSGFTRVTAWNEIEIEVITF